MDAWILYSFILYKSFWNFKLIGRMAKLSKAQHSCCHYFTCMFEPYPSNTVFFCTGWWSEIVRLWKLLLLGTQMISWLKNQAQYLLKQFLGEIRSKEIAQPQCSFCRGQSSSPKIFYDLVKLFMNYWEFEIDSMHGSII